MTTSVTRRRIVALDMIRAAFRAPAPHGLGRAPEILHFTPREHREGAGTLDLQCNGDACDLVAEGRLIHFSALCSMQNVNGVLSPMHIHFSTEPYELLVVGGCYTELVDGELRYVVRT